MPDARSVIALAFPHPRAAAAPSPRAGEGRGGGLGRIAAYALGRDYHQVLLERMQPFLAGGDMISSVDFQSAT